MLEGLMEIREKINHLVSDDYFEANRYNYLNGFDSTSSNTNDDIANAFTNTMPASYSIRSETHAEDQASSGSSARNTISSNALLRLKALRGLNTSNIYTKKVIKDGVKKLAARRKIMSLTYDIQFAKEPKESKAAYKARTKGINHPLIEKIFNEIAPKYAERKEQLGQGGGYTRRYLKGERRGDAAEVAIIELV